MNKIGRYLLVLNFSILGILLAGAETGSSITSIPEFHLKVTCPNSYSLNKEPADTSGNTYNFDVSGQANYPRLQTIVFITEQNVQKYDDWCKSLNAENRKFSCEQPMNRHMNKYLGEKKALAELNGYKEEKLMKFRNRHFLVATYFHHESALLRTYSFVKGKYLVTVTVQLQDYSGPETHQVESEKLSDALFSSLILEDM